MCSSVGQVYQCIGAKNAHIYVGNMPDVSIDSLTLNTDTCQRIYVSNDSLFRNCMSIVCARQWGQGVLPCATINPKWTLQSKHTKGIFELGIFPENHRGGISWCVHVYVGILHTWYILSYIYNSTFEYTHIYMYTLNWACTLCQSPDTNPYSDSSLLFCGESCAWIYIYILSIRSIVIFYHPLD